MIDRREILDFARGLELSANVVEKDYVIGWLLAGIANRPDLSPAWVFKGGTCLKKCYFETYRFSEDLDFPLTDSEQLNEEFLVDAFRQISDWVYEASGIQIPLETIRFEIYTNPRGNLSAQGRVGYRGPMGRGGDAPRVKLDLTSDEILVMEPVIRQIHHPYSDRPESGIQKGARVTEVSFSPRYLIELTPLGPIDAPAVTRRSTGTAYTTRRPRTTRARSKKTSTHYGPRYVFECAICGKKFPHTSYRAALNPHKNKQGFPCFGRTGIYVTTK